MPIRLTLRELNGHRTWPMSIDHAGILISELKATAAGIIGVAASFLTLFSAGEVLEDTWTLDCYPPPIGHALDVEISTDKVPLRDTSTETGTGSEYTRSRTPSETEVPVAPNLADEVALAFAVCTGSQVRASVDAALRWIEGSSGSCQDGMVSMDFNRMPQSLLKEIQGVFERVERPGGTAPRYRKVPERHASPPVDTMPTPPRSVPSPPRTSDLRQEAAEALAAADDAVLTTAIEIAMSVQGAAIDVDSTVDVSALSHEALLALVDYLRDPAGYVPPPQKKKVERVSSPASESPEEIPPLSKTRKPRPPGPQAARSRAAGHKARDPSPEEEQSEQDVESRLRKAVSRGLVELADGHFGALLRLLTDLGLVAADDEAISLSPEDWHGDDLGCVAGWLEAHGVRMDLDAQSDEED